MENKKHRVLKLLTVGTLIGSIFSSAGFINAQETLEPEDPIVEEEGLEVEEETIEETEQPIEEEEAEEVSKEPVEEVTEEPKEQTTGHTLLRNELLREEVTEVASGTWGTSEWMLDSEGTLTIGAGEFAYSDDTTRPNWYTNQSNITKIIFDGEVIANQESSYLFANLTNLVSIENIDYLNTANVENMRAMFDSSSNLTSLDLSSWNTSNVTSMRGMFNACTNLKSLNVSNFNTSKVTTMRVMFSSCTSLESLDVSSFDTSKVIDMYGVFRYCSNLTSFNMGSWDVSNVTDMSNMFQSCSALTDLTIDMSNSRNVKNMSGVFNTMTNLKEINGLETIDTSSVTNMSTMFYNSGNIKNLDLNSWDTSNVTAMGTMFSGTKSLETLDISDWDTSKVTSMTNMFQNCSSLKSLDITNWDTSEVTTMNLMFSGCTSLTSLDLGNWNTNKVTNMASMFSTCTNIEFINLKDWNTSNVINMTTMFYDCTNLKELDLSSFDTTNATSKSIMLGLCRKLTSIKLGEKTLITNTSLLAISGNDYTGRWVGLNSGTIYENSTSFMNTYDGSNPDTYVWEEKLTIYFDTNGANSITSQSLTTAQTITKPEDPIKTGYEFDGWYNDAKFESRWDFDTKVTESMTLYAKFDVIEYDISFIEDGSDFTDWSSSYSTPTKYTVEDYIVLPTANDMDVASNKIFAGWYEDESLSGDPILDIATGTTENQTYYAKFVTAEENYSIQYFEDEDTFTNWKEGFSATIIYSNNETQAIDLPDADQIEKRGYAFDGWYDNPELTGDEVTKIEVGETGTKKFYAKFVPIEYDINFKEGNSSFTDWASNYNDAPTIYTIEDEITLPTASNLLDRDGYTFAGWYDNETFDGEAVTTISEGSIGEKTYYAKYEVNDYTITFMDGSSGVVNWTSGYTVPTSYTVEEDVTLPTVGNLVEKTGYTFVGWYDNAELEGTAVTSIGTGTTGNKTYYAKYEVVPYTITFMNGSEAIASWNDYTAPSSYNIESTTITLPTKDNLVAHEQNYVFVGWYDNAELNGEPVTTIETGSTGNKTYYASYTDASIKLSLPVSIAMDAGNPTSITKGEKGTFSATVTNDSASTPNGIAWSVSGNNSIGTTMDATTGELTVADDETATSLTVVATSNAEDSKTATTTVAVANKPTLSMTMSQDKTKVLKGGSAVQFTATPNPTTATGEETVVTWGFDGNESVNTSLSSNGLLTIADDETATSITVTATATNGKTDPTTQTASGTVEIVEVGVSIPSAIVSLSRGQSYTFEASLTNDLDGDGVTWSLDDDTYSSIDATTGEVTIGAGETASSLTVTATSNADNTKTASATINVNPISIVIDDTDDIVVQGETREFTATTENDETANKNTATWSLTGANEAGTTIDPDTGVLTVDENEPADTVLTVTATSKTDTTAYAERLVTVEAVEIENDTREIDMLVENSFTLTASVAGGTWEYDDEYFSATASPLFARLMASVSGNSITLTAIKEGTSEITYTVYGVETSYTVTVESIELEIDLNDGNITISENADGDLVITNTDVGTSTVVSKDRELNIVDTTDTGNTVIVDTTDVDFRNVEGNITVTENGSGTISGDVTGNVTSDGAVIVNGDIEGSVTVEENGSANVSGDIKGEVTSNGELAVEGTITGDVIVNEGGSANVTGSVNGNIVSDGEVTVNGNITGDITITENGSADITGNVTGNISNAGGSLAIDGSVTGDVTSSNGASTSVTGDVDGDVTTDGSSTNTNIGGEVTGEVNDINGGTTIVETPDEPDPTDPTETLVMDGVPTGSVLVGNEFTLTPSIGGGTWSYDETYLEATKVESLSRLAVVGDAMTFKALKEGKTVINYTVNGDTYAYTVKIVEESASIAPEPNPATPTPGGTTQGSTTSGTDSNPATAVGTSDSTNTMPYAIMVVFSMLGIVAISMNRRRKYFNK